MRIVFYFLSIIFFLGCEKAQDLLPIDDTLTAYPQYSTKTYLPDNTCLLIREVVSNEMNYSIEQGVTEFCMQSTDNSSIWDIQFAEYCDTKFHWGNLNFSYSLYGECGVKLTWIVIEKEPIGYRLRMNETVDGEDFTVEFTML